MSNSLTPLGNVPAAPRRLIPALLGLGLSLAGLAGLASVAHAQSEREEAVLLARAGQMDEALSRLRAMLARGTDDPAVALDLVTLLEQAGRSAEAVSVWDRAAPRDPPSYALVAATRAFRDQKRFDTAADLARAGLRRFPDETVWPILLALILTDGGKAEEALTVLASPAARRAPEAERLLAQGYAARTLNRPFEALRAYADVARRDPANAEARDATRDLLRGMRAPFAAQRFAPDPPPQSLAGEQAAAKVRWGVDDRPFDPRRRFEGTDRAIAALDRLIDAPGAEPSLITGWRFDRMVALRDRVRMADVIREANELRADKVELPGYVRQALADALLYERQPEAARVEYEAVLANDRWNNDARVGRFYATLEMEDFAGAYEQADTILADQPVWRYFADGPSRYARGDYLDALLRAGLVRFYGDQPTEAWRRIAPERDAAPASQSARLAAASVMSGREWPRAAEAETRIASSLAPHTSSARIAMADTALARNRITEARERIGELVSIYPENRAVQRLQRDLIARTGWILDAELRPANERGGGVYGSNGNELNASFRIASPLIDDRWRLFAGYSYANATPIEGFVNRQRFTSGLELTLPDLTASVSVHQDMGSLSRTGFGGSLNWTPTDHLTLSVAAQHMSQETPLRALLYGITADSVNTRVTYQWDEAHSLSFGAGWMPFTDGNQRYSLDARYRQKLIAMPRFSLTGEAELYTSSNSKPGGPYYAPSADGSASVGLVAEHVLWRRYERSLSHSVSLQGGWYGERDYTGGAIGSMSYQHRWRFDPWTELAYGVSVAERIYDGDRSRNFRWSDLNADGVTDMGKALSMVADALKIESMPPRGLPPVLVLISDGQPTDDFNGGLKKLLDQPWGMKSVRIAVAIGDDADLDVLQKFIGNSEVKPLVANNVQDLSVRPRGYRVI